ncbi:MAG: SPOR domain-containing protein [Betaproteobacteria bacterium]
MIHQISSRPFLQHPHWPRQHHGHTLLGIIIGFVLGLAVAAGIAYVLNKTPNPFDGKVPRTDIASPRLSSVERDNAKPGDKPRFDFSKILPGTEERKAAQKDDDIARAPADKPAAPLAVEVAAKSDPGAKSGKYFLQAGAYQNAADAEDQRAQLALMGIEASLQAVTIPEKGTLNRVRLGPYATAEEMNQVKTELLKHGIATAVIKNP